MTPDPAPAARERCFGGRSARIQAAVHKAVEDLLRDVERSELTVPQIAAQAGVTPSTIYRRWGGLAELLADVAVKRLRPIAEPADTGSLRTDLAIWAEQFMDEMSSDVGRAMIRDVFADATTSDPACRCCAYSEDQLKVIAERAARRGERAFAIDEMIDQVVAPIMYRILYGGKPLSADYCHALVDRALAGQPRCAAAR